MPDNVDYLIRPAPAGSSRPARALWRRIGDRWEYYSLIDWSWHSVPDQAWPQPPDPADLQSVSAERAAAMAADRQRWVRYWAVYRDPPTSPDDRPLTVIRRRNSPEQTLDEAYTIHHEWRPDPSIRENELGGRVSDPPPIVEIDRATAERILREVRGVPGATEL